MEGVRDMKYSVGTFNELKVRLVNLKEYSHYDMTGYVSYCIGFDIQRCENITDNFNRFSDKELDEIYNDIIKRIERIKESVIKFVKEI